METGTIAREHDAAAKMLVDCGVKGNNGTCLPLLLATVLSGNTEKGSSLLGRDSHITDSTVTPGEVSSAH